MTTDQNWNKKIRLHLGPHLKETEALQKLIHRNRALLKQSGATYISPKRCERDFFTPLQYLTKHAIGLDIPVRPMPEELGAQIYSFLSNLMSEAGEVVFLSSARVLGGPSTVVNSGLLFPRKNAFLEGLSGALLTAPQQISVSVSSYADFFSECYAHYLKQSPTKNFVSSEAFAETIMQRHPSWKGFLTTIQSAFPDSEIKVWRLDKAETDYRSAIDLLFDEKLGSRFSYGDTSERGAFETMSQDAFNKFLAQARKDGIDVALSKLGTLSDEFPCSGTSDRMNVFTDEQASELSKRYEADLAELDLLK